MIVTIVHSGKINRNKSPTIGCADNKSVFIHRIQPWQQILEKKTKIWRDKILLPNRPRWMSISFHFNRPSDCWCDRHHLGANMLSSLCDPLSCKQTPPSTHISLSQQQTEEKAMLVRAWALTGCLCLASGRMRGERFRNLRPWRHGAAAAGLSLQAPFVDLRPLELPVVGGETWNTLHQFSPPGSRQLLTGASETLRGLYRGGGMSDRI